MSEVFEGVDTDKMASNLLEKGRYKAETVDIEGFNSKAGNRCNKIILKTEDGFQLKDICLCEGKMSWKWSQYLYANGIRQKGRFTVPKERLVGSKCLVDVGVKDRTLDDGSIIKENKINSYSPIENEIAPIKDVEPEPEPKNEKQIEPQKESEPVKPEEEI